MTGEPSDADRTLVAREVEHCRKLAVEARAAHDTPGALYADGIADLLELASVADGAKFVREKTLRALAGRSGVDIPGASPVRPQERWLATWWLTHRTRTAREALNRERALMGLPPIIRNVMAQADEWD